MTENGEKAMARALDSVVSNICLTILLLALLWTCSEHPPIRNVEVAPSKEPSP